MPNMVLAGKDATTGAAPIEAEEVARRTLQVLARAVPAAVPGIVFLSGGSFLNLFPIGGISSDQYDSFTTMGKLWDRIHHFILPLT